MATDKYDFLVLYNEALTKREETDDNRLSEHFTKYLVDKFKLKGKRGYFSKTDKILGEDVFKQLSRLVKGTDKTVVVFTPGFLKDCWKKYCHRSAFKQLIDQDKAEKLIPISLCLTKEDIVGVEELNISTWVEFDENYRKENDDNENNWNLIGRALNSTDSLKALKGNDESSHVTAQETGDNRLRTSGNALVAQPSNEFFNDAMIKELANSCSANWMQLCISLDLPSNKAKEIERNYPSDCWMQAFEGITYALKKIGGNAEEQYNKVKEAFTELHRNDLVQILEKKYRKYQDQNSQLIDGENVSGVDIRGTSSSGDIQDGALPENQEQEILYDRRSDDIPNVSQESASTAREIRAVTHTISIMHEERPFIDTVTMDAGPSASLPPIPHLAPKSHEIPGVFSDGNDLQDQLTNPDDADKTQLQESDRVQSKQTKQPRTIAVTKGTKIDNDGSLFCEGDTQLKQISSEGNTQEKQLHDDDANTEIKGIYKEEIAHNEQPGRNENVCMKQSSSRENVPIKQSSSHENFLTKPFGGEDDKMTYGKDNTAVDVDETNVKQLYENQHSLSADSYLSVDGRPLSRLQEDRQPLDSSALDNFEMLDLKSLQQDSMSSDSGLESNLTTISSVDNSIDKQINYAIVRPYGLPYDGEIDNTPATEEDVTPALSPEIDSEMTEVTIEGAMCGNDQYNSASQNQNTRRDRILSSNTMQSIVSSIFSWITRPEYAYY